MEIRFTTYRLTMPFLLPKNSERNRRRQYALVCGCLDVGQQESLSHHELAHICPTLSRSLRWCQHCCHAEIRPALLPCRNQESRVICRFHVSSPFQRPKKTAIPSNSIPT